MSILNGLISRAPLLKKVGDTISPIVGAVVQNARGKIVLHASSGDKVYSSIYSAMNDAAAGDLVEVFPGTYNITQTVMLKDGVTLYFHKGATLVGSGGITMFSNASAGTFRILGMAKVELGGTFIETTVSSSSYYVELESLQSDICLLAENLNGVNVHLYAVSFIAGGMIQAALEGVSELIIVSPYIRMTEESSVGVPVTKMVALTIDVTTLMVTATRGMIISNLLLVESLECFGVTVIADEIFGTSGTSSVRSGGSTLLSRSIKACVRPYDGKTLVVGRIEAGGMFPAIISTGGNLDVIGSVNASGNPAIRVDDGSLRVSGRVESTTHNAVVLNGGEITVEGEVVSGGAPAVNITAGTYRQTGGRIVSAWNNAGGHGIVKSGGNAVLSGGTAIVLTHASAESLSSTTAQDVVVYGTGGAVSNRNKNVNVTVRVGTLVVDGTYVI